VKQSPEFIIFKIPAFTKWNSAQFAGDQFVRFFQKHYKAKSATAFKSLPSKKQIWLIPYGRCHETLFQYLEVHFPNPQLRPPIWFYWNGQGTLVGKEIYKYKKLFGSLDRWIVSCESEKQILDWLFPNNQRTFVHPFPLPKVRIKEEKMALRKQFSLPQKAKLAVYAGRISVQKNIHFLLQWLEVNPEFQMAIAGDIDDLKYPHLNLVKNYDSYIELLNQYCEKKSLWNRLHLFPHLEQTDLQRLFKACDLNISLSTHYGEDFGISVAQGILSGLPSVLTDWGGHKNWKSLPQLKSCVQWVPTVMNDRFLPVPQVAPVQFSLLKSPKKIDLEKQLKLQISETLKICNRKAPPVRSSQTLVKFWERQYGTALFQSGATQMYQNIIRFYAENSK
jgi:glycosyltransferase involved in cell wall biosynthesis